MSVCPDVDDAARLNRRQALSAVATLLGGAALIGSPRLLAAMSAQGGAIGPGAFTPGEIAYLDEIADTILPATHTPGAKAAQTGAFIARMVSDCYSPQEQRVFRDGLLHIDAAMRERHGTAFMDASAAERLALLSVLDREQKRVMDERERQAREHSSSLAPPALDTQAPAHVPEQRKEASPEQTGREVEPAPQPPAHYFRMLKELTLLGYFTSQIGCTVAQRYVETPGRFDPCLPYHPGEPSSASHA